jgi:HKD family nuclease
MSIYTNQDPSTRLMPRLVSALSNATDIEIAVGFFGSSFSPALEKQITRAASYARVRILLGMYFYRGMKEAEYKRAEAINNALLATGKAGSGVYIAHKEYHGKLYKFEYAGEGDDTLIMGSSNLSPDGLEKRLECNVELLKSDHRYRALASYLDDLFSAKISHPFTSVDLQQKRRIVKTGRAA